MSYRSREKKRRAKAAIRNARAKQRETGKHRRYLTIVKRTCSCNRCADRLREGGEMVFRFEPKEVLCLNCATLLGLGYRTSLSWEKAQRKHRRRRPSRA